LVLGLFHQQFNPSAYHTKENGGLMISLLQISISPDWAAMILFLLLALVAETLGTLGGFGSSMLFVPLASLFLDFQSVLGITALFHVMSNLAKIGLFRHGFRGQQGFAAKKGWYLALAIPAMLFVGLGALLTKAWQGPWLEASMGLLIALLAALLLRFTTFTLKASWLTLIAGGTLSGFLAGLVGTGGAIRGITLSAFGLTKDTFVAISAFIDLGVDSTRALVYFQNGFVHTHDLYLLPGLLVVSILGTWLGKVFLNYLPEARFKQLVLWLILFTGLAKAITSFIATT
jgi:uncharacterized membrane protein YfcA